MLPPELKRSTNQMGVTFGIEGVGSLGEIMNSMMSGGVGINHTTTASENQVEILEETQLPSLDEQVKEELKDLNE